jgi:class 3 adenylate cyclase
MESRFSEALLKSGLAVGMTDPPSLFLTVRHVPFGEAVCRRGDLADRLWIVTRGRLTAQSPEILRQRPVYVPYMLVGERGVLGKMVERVADLISDDEHTELLEITAADIERHPQNYLLYRNIGAINSDRVLAAYKDNENLAAERAELLETVRRYVGTDFLNRRTLIPDDYRDCASEDVVIWFSDIAGFSTRCVGVEPARVAQFIRTALGRQILAVQSSSGYIDKLMGDGIMAYWPARSHDRGVSACENACNAALRAIENISSMSFDGQPVSIRIGLNFGTVFIGEFGTPERAQYTLIGHEVNKAARLESARDDSVVEPAGGKLGVVRIGESLYERLPSALIAQFPQAVTLELKGVGRVNAYTSSPT